MAHIQPCIVRTQPSSPPPPILGVAGKRVCETTTHPVHKTLATAANLANLLPTGTLLTFRTLTPPFSNKGTCQLANVCLTAGLIFVFAIFCFFSTFIDTFRDCDGKLYYGTATFRGLYVFNSRSNVKMRRESQEEEEEEEYFSKFKIRAIDFLHAIVSVLVFLIFAMSDSDVQRCFFPEAGENMKVLMMNLPMAAGFFSSSLFVLFPTTRRGSGYADLPCQK